jgi:hypothetical protein
MRVDSVIKLKRRKKHPSPLTHLPKSFHREIPLCTRKIKTKGRGNLIKPK